MDGLHEHGFAIQHEVGLFLFSPEESSNERKSAKNSSEKADVLAEPPGNKKALAVRGGADIEAVRVVPDSEVESLLVKEASVFRELYSAVVCLRYFALAEYLFDRVVKFNGGKLNVREIEIPVIQNVFRNGGPSERINDKNAEQENDERNNGTTHINSYLGKKILSGVVSRY